MLEPLSEPRRRLLLSLNLCTPADLRRAQARVRQLVRDLPAFDSVWIDALVQLRRLTPFQARLLESSQPEQLRIGPCILINRIGGGPLAETFLARSRRSTERFVAKILRAGSPPSAAAEDRVRELINRLRGLNSPFVVGPQAFHQIGTRLLLVSPVVEGPHLGELLVRRGRFPPAIVQEIARQLADGMVEVEKRGLVHGDIRADNVRLTPHGAVTLVDAGVRGALDADLSIHSGLPPGHYDGIAPERIGSTAGPTTASDLYSLGCLLWQLLAGRPPFPAGDPLFKLAAHQSRDVDDVRKWSPETPADLAEGIRALTRRDPARRPRRAADLLTRWGPPTSHSRRALSAFHRQFSRPAPLPARHVSRQPAGTSLASLILVASLLAGAWLLPQSRAVLLSLGTRWSGNVQEPPASDGPTTARRILKPTTAESPGVTDTGEEDLADLPAPDPKGTIRLQPGRQYRAQSLVHIGDLRIVGDRESLPGIVIDRPSWKLAAETIRMEGVSIRSTETGLAPATPGAPSISLRCQSVRLEGCLIACGNSNSQSPALLEWSALSPEELRTAKLSFRNCLFAVRSTAVVASGASQIEFQNTLCVGGSTLCECEMPGRHLETRVLLDRITCREMQSVLRLKAPAGETSVGTTGRFLIDTQNCVFDVDPEDGALVEFTDSDGPSRLQISGEGSLVPEQLTTVLRTTTGEAVDLAAIPLEGLIATPYRFAGKSSSRPVDSEIADCDAPRRSPLPPGIVAADLPSLP